MVVHKIVETHMLDMQEHDNTNVKNIEELNNVSFTAVKLIK